MVTNWLPPNFAGWLQSDPPNACKVPTRPFKHPCRVAHPKSRRLKSGQTWAPSHARLITIVAPAMPAVATPTVPAIGTAGPSRPRPPPRIPPARAGHPWDLGRKDLGWSIQLNDNTPLRNVIRRPSSPYLLVPKLLLERKWRRTSETLTILG